VLLSKSGKLAAALQSDSWLLYVGLPDEQTRLISRKLQQVWSVFDVLLFGGCVLLGCGWDVQGSCWAQSGLQATYLVAICVLALNTRGLLTISPILHNTSNWLLLGSR
jgi:hypothetical protein